MKPLSIPVRRATAIVAAIASAFSMAHAADDIVPLITIDNVPLTAAIRNLARQADSNFILDPRVPGSGFSAGKRTPEPSVSGRWQNTSAPEALNALLKDTS